MDSTAAATTITDPGTVTVSVAPASATESEAVEFTITLSDRGGERHGARLDDDRRHRDFR